MLRALISRIGRAYKIRMVESKYILFRRNRAYSLLGQMLEGRIRSKLRAPVIDGHMSMPTEAMEGLLETRQMEKRAMRLLLETWLIRTTRAILDIRMKIMTITMISKVIIHSRFKAVKAMTKDTKRIMMTLLRNRMTTTIEATLAAGGKAPMIEETKILTLTLKSILLASTERLVSLISEMSFRNMVRSNVSS